LVDFFYRSLGELMFLIGLFFSFFFVSDADAGRQCVPRRVYDLSLYPGFDRDDWDVYDAETCVATVHVDYDPAVGETIRMMDSTAVNAEVTRLVLEIRSVFLWIQRIHKEDWSAYLRSMGHFSYALCSGARLMYYAHERPDRVPDGIVMSAIRDPGGRLGGPGYAAMLMYRAVDLGYRDAALLLWHELERVEEAGGGLSCSNEIEGASSRRYAAVLDERGQEAADQVRINFQFLPPS